MCTIVITLTFGFTLSYVALPRLQHILATSPEYTRSHWTDVHAFAIANKFDSAFSHLLVAVIIAGILGTLGSFMGAAVARHRSQRQAQARDVRGRPACVPRRSI